MVPRLHLCRRWTGQPPAPADLAGFALREACIGDESTVGSILWAAFRGSGEDDFRTVDAAVTEVRQTLDGKWGALMGEASLVATFDGQVAAAVLTVMDDAHGGVPLLAFAATAPEHQGMGAGDWLIRQVIHRLGASGFDELHLAVLATNRARRLYDRLGFQPAQEF